MKRQTTKSGAQETSAGVKAVELVLVVDYAIYLRNGGNMPKILKRVFDVVNIMKEVNLISLLIFTERKWS